MIKQINVSKHHGDKTRNLQHLETFVVRNGMSTAGQKIK